MSELREMLEIAHSAACRPTGRLAMMLAKSGFRAETIGVLRDCIAGYEQATALTRQALDKAEQMMQERMKSRPPSPGEERKTRTEFDFEAEMPESVRGRRRR